VVVTFQDCVMTDLRNLFPRQQFDAQFSLVPVYQKQGNGAFYGLFGREITAKAYMLASRSVILLSTIDVLESSDRFRSK
jgi:hypothetical protein